MNGGSVGSEKLVCMKDMLVRGKFDSMHVQASI